MSKKLSHPRIAPVQARVETPGIEVLELRIAPSTIFVVSTLKDTTDPAHDTGSLRDAILNANDTPGADSIVFQKTKGGKTTPLSGTILLNGSLGGLPVVTDDLTISGPVQGKANSIIIDGHNNRLFQIGTRTNLAVSVSMSDLTLRHGANDWGGAISFNAPDGTLSLNDVAITANTAFGGVELQAMGGGIAIEAGTVAISKSTISNNLARGNRSAGLGGGIGCLGTLTLDQSIVSGNIARGADASGGGAIGGGIVSGNGNGPAGNVTVLDSIISSNKAIGGKGWNGDFGGPSGGDGGQAFGGGIAAIDGTVTVLDSQVLNNLAKGGNGGAGHNSLPMSGMAGGRGGAGQKGCGGGVASLGLPNTLNIQTSVISGNKAVAGKPGMSGAYYISYSSARVPGTAWPSEGGGVYSGMAATISQTTVSKNSAELGGGAAFGADAAAVVGESTFCNNRALMEGGLFITGQSKLQNTTIAYNRAAKEGGGILAQSFSGFELFIHNCTIAKNNARFGGGLDDNNVGITEVVSSIIAFNQATSNPDLDGIIQGNHNLVRICETPNATFLHDPTNLFNVDPMLGPLADHGGPTFTMLPSATSISVSPAIDAGSNPDSLADDQRSDFRLLGAAPDIGAVEVA